MKGMRSPSGNGGAAKRVFVISPHPDDESRRVVFLTSGEKGGHGRSAEETIRIREAEARVAAQVPGVEDVDFWREPDGAFRATSALAARLGDLLRQWRPQVLYVPHERETHPDHRAARRLVRRALRGLSRAHSPAAMEFEVWTPLQRIDRIVNVPSHIQVKMAAIRAYKSQCEVRRFDEALMGLNRYRGEMHSWPGGDYAEVFTIWRKT